MEGEGLRAGGAVIGTILGATTAAGAATRVS